jgi:Flp pilus assembly protein TadD
LAPLIDRALQAHRQGLRDVAERLCRDVQEHAPGETRTLAVLFEIRKAAGALGAAEVLAGRIVARDPNNHWATTELALLLLARGALAEAERHARNAVRLAPENPQSHNLMGMILTEAQRPQVGEYHYRKVLALAPRRDPILLANLAWNLKNQGRMTEARALYGESVAAAPGVLQTLLGWARLEEADRQFDQAAGVLDQAERLAPDNPSVRLSRAVLLGRQGRHEAALAVLDAGARASRDGELGPDELLEKGRLLDRLGLYDDAFAAFAAGKRKSRALGGHAYLAVPARDLAARLAGFFTAGRLRLLPRAGQRRDSPQPLFVLGFPRSGTTLVEQTLSAHPAISAGDELPTIEEIAALMPRMLESPLAYPEALAELWMGDHRDDLDLLRDHYLRRARQLGAIDDACAWFTDKMPLNETHLGLIALLFPAAPLVHVLRHPLDVVLSVFSNQMTHGFCCAFDLESAARHYVLVMELVERYRAEMDLRYLPVRYEDLVAAQAAWVRRILDFVGVPFDPRCLAFHENRRYARTASYAQVAEKLYDRSVYRHRHYLRHLEPVIPILRPAIERLGYSIG